MAIYNYTISPLSVDRLQKDINDSKDISVKLDHISSLGSDVEINFLAELSTAEQSALGAIVSAHTGEPLPPEVITQPVEIKNQPGVSITNLAVQTTGELKVSSNVTEGSSVFLVSHDFCDKTTWWSESVRAQNETLSADQSYLTYSSAHENWIDLEHGKIPYEANYSSTYKPHVYVDGQEVTTGFSIDYAAGTVTFDSSKEGNVVTATYSYANGSNWIVTPSSGKFLRLLGAEIKFAKNVILDDGQQIAFRIYVNNYCVSEVLYKSVKDLIKCIVGTPHVIPAFGGLTYDTMVLPYSYITVKDLKSSLNMQIKIGLKTSAPLTGEWGSMSISCLSISE